MIISVHASMHSSVGFAGICVHAVTVCCGHSEHALSHCVPGLHKTCMFACAQTILAVYNPRYSITQLLELGALRAAGMYRASLSVLVCHAVLVWAIVVLELHIAAAMLAQQILATRYPMCMGTKTYLHCSSCMMPAQVHATHVAKGSARSAAPGASCAYIRQLQEFKDVMSNVSNACRWQALLIHAHR
jgi:hypothetical protein